MSTFEILIGFVFVMLMIAAWTVGTRRNRRAIEQWDDEDSREIEISLAEWQIPRAETMLRTLGWRLAKKDKVSKGRISVRFEKIDDLSSNSVKTVLHRLNSSGYLSIGSIRLGRIDEHQR